MEVPRTQWGCSSVGRAVRSQRTGQGFKSPHLHQSNQISSNQLDPRKDSDLYQFLLSMCIFSLHLLSIPTKHVGPHRFIRLRLNTLQLAAGSFIGLGRRNPHHAWVQDKRIALRGSCMPHMRPASLTLRRIVGDRPGVGHASFLWTYTIPVRY
jgi:hypothetical protein